MVWYSADELPESLSWIPDAWNRQQERIAALEDRVRELEMALREKEQDE